MIWTLKLTDIQLLNKNVNMNINFDWSTLVTCTFNFYPKYMCTVIMKQTRYCDHVFAPITYNRVFVQPNLKLFQAFKFFKSIQYNIYQILLLKR